MQPRQLHLALREYCTAAGFVLAGAVAQGAEVAYEVVPEGGRRGGAPPLYCYRALTGQFLASQQDRLRALDTYLPALHSLVALDGLDAYLDSHGVPHEKASSRELAEAVLEHFTARVFDGTEPRFDIRPEHFEPAYRDLERCCVQGEAETVVLGLLRGITTESEEVALAEGVLLAPPSCLEDMPPDPMWIRRDGPALVVAIAPGDTPGALAGALARLRELQTALRLFAGGVSLAPLAWVRGDGTPWRPVPVRAGGRAGGTLTVTSAQEDELRAFCNLIAKRVPESGPVAWAVERFEQGCESADPLGGITDHLLALRALLEPEGAQSGRMPGRLAALCAVPEGRTEMSARVGRAVALESAVIGGLDDRWTEEARELAAEIEGHLRALLRDLVCGHLRGPLDTLADRILLEDEAPPEPEPAYAEPEYEYVEPESEYVEPEPEYVAPEPEYFEPEVEYPDTDPLPAQEETAEHPALATGDAYEDLEAWGEPAPFQPELFS
jgi:hypothetical protein